MMRMKRLVLALLLAILTVGVIAAMEDDSLPNTIIDEDGRYTVSYPADWVADNVQGGVVVANSQAALGNYADFIGDIQLDPGQIIGAVDFVPLDAYVEQPVTMPIDAALDAYVAGLLEDVQDEIALDFEGAARSFVQNSVNAAIIYGTFTRPDSVVYPLALIIGRIKAEFSQTIFIGYETDLTAIDATMRAIATSVERIDPESAVPTLPPVRTEPPPATAPATGEATPTRHPAIPQADRLPVNLTQTISLPDGSFTVRYQEGWVAQADSLGAQIYLANNADTLDAIQSPDVPDLPAGNIGGVVVALPVEIVDVLGVDADTPVTEVVDVLVEALFTGGGDAGFSIDLPAAEGFSINGIEGGISTGTVEDTAITLSLSLIVTRIDGGFALGLFYAPVGEIGQYRDILVATMLTVE